MGFRVQDRYHFMLILLSLGHLIEVISIDRVLFFDLTDLFHCSSGRLHDIFVSFRGVKRCAAWIRLSFTHS